MRKPKPFCVGDNVRLFRKLLLTKDRECLQVGETGKVLDVSKSGLRIYVQFDNDFKACDAAISVASALKSCGIGWEEASAEILAKFVDTKVATFRPGYGHGRLCSHEELEVINP